MKLRSKILGMVMAGAFATAASLVGAGAGTAHAATAASLVSAGTAHAATDPNTCFIQTDNGNYITAVGGGGRTSDVIHTNATVPSTWERFTLVYSGDGSHYGLRTAFGYYVTAVNSGGLSSSDFPDVLHTDATVLANWEKFSFVTDGTDGKYGLRAFDGHLLSAVGGGGRTSRAFDSNRTVLSTWEKFRFTCNV